MNWVLESPLFHLTQAVDSVDTARDVYARLFARPVRDGGVTLGRTALFTRVGDQLLEAMIPGEGAVALGRFVERYGSHWHSLGWYVKNIDGLAATLLEHDKQIATTAGEFITEAHVPRNYAPAGSDQGDGWWSAPMWTRLHQERGIAGMYEFVEPKTRHELNSWRAGDPVEHDPLTVVRGSHVTTVVSSAADVAAFWCDVLGGRQLAMGPNEALGSLSAWVSVSGDDRQATLMEFAEPVTAGSAADDRGAAGLDILHAYTFLVRDLDAVRTHVAKEGFGLCVDTEHCVVTDPATTAGARYGFIDGDPF
jgi:catechol 2,3-dioxygenase-like lactoylglutathione lyase family enzyme